MQVQSGRNSSVSVFLFVEVLLVCTPVKKNCITFLLENRQKWSVYEFGDARLSQWNTVVVFYFRVVRCLVFTRPPWSRSWPSWPFGSDKVTRSDY